MNGRLEFTEEEQAVVHRAYRRYARSCAEGILESLNSLDMYYPMPSKLKADMADNTAKTAQKWAEVELFLIEPASDYADKDMPVLREALEDEVEHFIDAGAAECDDDTGEFVLARVDGEPAMDECDGMETAELETHLALLDSACKKVAACTDTPFLFGRFSV